MFILHLQTFPIHVCACVCVCVCVCECISFFPWLQVIHIIYICIHSSVRSFFISTI